MNDIFKKNYSRYSEFDESDYTISSLRKFYRKLDNNNNEGNNNNNDA